MSKGSCGVGYFVGGLSVGFLATLLLAPQSGEETRKTISRKASESRDYLSAQRDAVLKKASAAGQGISDLASATKEFVS